LRGKFHGAIVQNSTKTQNNSLSACVRTVKKVLRRMLESGS
jgi:hypothetical protein